jgi:hypothetical protein
MIPRWVVQRFDRNVIFCRHRVAGRPGPGQLQMATQGSPGSPQPEVRRSRSYVRQCMRFGFSRHLSDATIICNEELCSIDSLSTGRPPIRDCQRLIRWSNEGTNEDQPIASCPRRQFTTHGTGVHRQTQRTYGLRRPIPSDAHTKHWRPDTIGNGKMNSSSPCFGRWTSSRDITTAKACQALPTHPCF